MDVHNSVSPKQLQCVDADPLTRWASAYCDIMQYTGLKDRNGEEIYEGDIIEIDGGGVPIRTLIFFEDGCYCVKMKENICELKYYINMSFCTTKIIGNIYENPELLQ